ncbi:MAG: LVIVD repeat protein [Petrotoga mobilis]|nr:MAG: LVIVD repeat protein [Petrotoga mobilis]
MLSIVIFYIRIAKERAVQGTTTQGKDVTNSFAQEQILTSVVDAKHGVIVAGYEGFYVFDGGKKEIIATVTTGSYVNDAQIYGDYLYLVDREGLKIYDFSDPQRVALLNSYSTFGDSLSVTTNGELLFVADGENGLISFDLKDKVYIRLKEHIRLPGMVTQVEMFEKYLFIIGPGLGMKVYQINENQTLEELNFYDQLISPRMISFNNDFFMLNDDLLGIHIFKMKDLINTPKYDLKPLYIWNYEAYSIQLLDDSLYFSTNNGIYKRNLKSLETQEIITGQFFRPNILVNDGYIYLTNNEDGLYIYDLNTKKLLKYINTVGSIDDFVVLESGVLIDEGGKIVYLDKQKEKLWEKRYTGSLIKSKKGFYELSGNIVNFYDAKNTTTKSFPENIIGIKETQEGIFVIAQENIYSFFDGTKVFIGMAQDIEVIDNLAYIAVGDKITEFNFLTGKSSFKFYSKDYIDQILSTSDGFILLTEKGVFRTDFNFNIIDYFSFDYSPDIIMLNEKYIFYSVGSHLTIVEVSNFGLNRTINSDLPILSMDCNDGYLYISYSSKGITRYNITDKLQLVDEEIVVNIFTAKNIIF